MNVNKNAVYTQVLGVIRSNQPEREKSRGVLVERCEFEALLQRAMEILSARARTATTSSS
ncbi:MAG TPA: hypothetical protein VMO76_07925 [Candidatus Udaeobacter sp.]|jgi:hypothetical protein|nr:hypothetical protein [Candidatus Udaeobacter sp.]